MVRYAAESGSELSCRDATGMTLMTETVNEFLPIPITAIAVLGV
jgi:hypothetical protein